MYSLFQIIVQVDPKLCLPDHLSIQQIAKLIKNWCLPNSLLQTVCSEESFKNGNFVIRAAAVKYLVTSLKKLHELIENSNRSSEIIVTAVVKHLNQVCYFILVLWSVFQHELFSNNVLVFLRCALLEKF